MLFLMTSFLVIGLSLQLTPQKVEPYIQPTDFHTSNKQYLKLHLANGEKSSTSSSSDSSSSVSSSEADISAELREADVKKPNDVLALFVVDDSHYARGRRGKLLEPYQSIINYPPAQTNQRRLDEANYFTKLHTTPNTNYFKNRPVNHKGQPKELYQNNVKPSHSRGEPRLPGHATSEPKVLQNIPYVEELLSIKNEGLAIPAFPDVNVQPLNHNERAKDGKQNGGTPPNQESDSAGKEKTYTVRKDQLLALRARWSKKCDKAAAKECKKACKRAEKTACSDYKCHKGLKKALKKECKRHCKKRFLENGSGCSG